MKGEDFTFTHYIPDLDDIVAQNRACKEFLNTIDPHILRSMTEVDLFMIGFNRGMAWCYAKDGRGIPEENLPINPRPPLPPKGANDEDP